MSYKWWISIAIGLFGVGFVFGLDTPTGMAGLAAEDMAALRELGNFLASLPPPVTALFIFIKNVSVVVLSFVLSPILCLVPVLTLTLNGWLLSFISVAVIQEESLGFVLAGLLPHGVFELPALIIGQAAALRFGIVIMLAVISRERRNQLMPSVKKDLKYLIIALGLLLPAAIIETYITPLLLG
ncbi:stage II sporulation protein M [Chloroflexota bacterium]